MNNINAKATKSLLAFAIAAGVASFSIPSFANDVMPVVPANIVAEAHKKARNSNTATTQAPAVQQAPVQHSPGAQINESSNLIMSPGVNQVIPVAIDHPNRIVTPFSTPEVVSTSLTGMDANGNCGEVCIKDNVVYVATDKEHPVTMFITEKGTEARALSLTMVPRRIPPREVFLRMADSALYDDTGMTIGSTKAKAWERSQPYIETVRTAFRGLALGELPQGYTLTKTPKKADIPYCEHPTVAVNFMDGQLATGHNLNIFIGVATNTSNEPIEFREAWCGGWDVAAAAVWPNNVLAPGEKTEVFVAKKLERNGPKINKRRSLLD